MEIFLKKVAFDLYQKHGDQLNQLSVVFPNRRAGIFFINYLKSLAEKPLLSPEITTIDKLFTSSSGYFIPDRLNLIFRLYKVYRELTSSNESFDDFYYWGGMLVSDFDQVDKYMVNARELFENITDLKEIDEHFQTLGSEQKEVVGNFWKTVITSHQSPNQEEFVRLWKELAKIYDQFKSVLHSERTAYEGMVYRSVIEEINSGKTSYFHDKQYAFVGFNALNCCEEELFSYLKNSNQATFYWDYDDSYLKDPNQEAGLFMRKNLEKFPQADFSLSSDSLYKEDKSFKILNVSSQVAQTQVAGEEIARLISNREEKNFEDIAVVLCEEELLLPVISALPAEVDKVNITMGFPLKMTPVYNLINHLADLQKFSKVENGEVNFYFKNILAILNNQLILSIYPADCRQLANSIKINNLVYLNEKDLGLNDLFALIFRPVKSLQELSDYLPSIIGQIFLFWKGGGKEDAFLVREYIYQAFLAINRLKENILIDGVKILGNNNFISLPTFFRLIDQYLSETIIPFEGEPIQGLQVMGILETRTLDFKNIILLSVNDGIMPRISSTGSFIPFNLRRVYGLPTIEEQNAMYAYYFYRLIQRAQDVTFVYNSGSNGMSTGEKSRYLYQLQMESALNVPESTVVYRMKNRTPFSISIDKDEKVMASLNKYLDGGHPLSPTALDKYLACSLQFYFRYVAGLKEPEEMAEEVDQKIFGLLFHKCMENLYSQNIGKLVQKADLELLMDDVLLEKVINDAFREIYFKGFSQDAVIQYSGKNWLIFKILKKYIHRILEIDLGRTPFQIEGIEKQVYTSIDLNDSFKVKIGGIIDRLDRQNGELQILDYKTGKAELVYSTLSGLFDRENDKRNKAAFQTLVYSCILHRNLPEETSIKPGIYHLRGLFEDHFEAFLKCKENGNTPVDYLTVCSQFEDQLLTLLKEIFDPSVPFQKTSIEGNCTYCPYIQICRTP